MSVAVLFRNIFKPCRLPITAISRRAVSASAQTVASPKCIGTESGDDYFRYTSGRYLFNEACRFEERLQVFNVGELKKIVVAAINKDVTDITCFRKLAEGGFNRVFELTINDSLQILAKIPYPFTYPKHFTVASEVATMDFVRSYGLPVPKVLGYSTTMQNPVGTEYVIMEKLKGKDLGECWYQLPEEKRLKIVAQIAKLEAIMFSIALPASGSIYYRHDLDDGAASVEIPSRNGLKQLCIGPDAGQKWWYGRRSQLEVSRGPFLEAKDAFMGGALKELAWMKQFGRPRFPRDLGYRELHGYEKTSPAEYITLLEKYLEIAPYLVPSDEAELLRPTFRHPDFQPRNILVDGDFNITGLIDWQHCSVLPLLLQAGIPEYLQNYGDEESEYLRKPSQPENLAEMSDDERAQALEQYRKRQLHYYYFAGTSKLNKPHFNALWLDSTLPKQRLVHYASLPWEGENVTLKAELIRAVRNWDVLCKTKDGTVPPCPISFTKQEVEECLRLDGKQKEADDEMEQARALFGIGYDGWTSHERYEKARELNHQLKMLQLEGKDGAARTRILRYWPFDDHDDDG